MPAKEQAKIILAVTGGVACFKAAALASQLAQQGHSVQVVMTPAAESFVGSATFAALTGHPVATELFDPAFPLGAHIELARQADVLCVAPATANFIGKAAHGISDDLLSTLYLCFTGTVVIAPAMNCEMWEKASVQRNVDQLRNDGVQIVDPGEGWLSCRTKGVGRMAEPALILEKLNEL
jgi:phosphopantothenoylcysteine decarboxylase/phosphopantothenate--cysteine ligase